MNQISWQTLVSYSCSVVNISLTGTVRELFVVELSSARGRHKSAEVGPFDRATPVSHSCSIVTISLTRTVSELFVVEISSARGRHRPEVRLPIDSLALVS